MNGNVFARFRRLGRWVGFVALATVAACEEVDPPLQFSGTGAVEGLAFFDASEDGIFDPSDGDYPVPGIGIAIQDRGTGQTFAGGTAQSGADGRFVVASVPAGTHDMLIDTLTVPAGVSICQNPLRVTVYFNETQFSNVQGRPGCLITIAEAKDLGAGGDFVVVRGIVTSFPGQVDASRTFIEDATAGTLIFSSSLEGMGIQIGDQIEIGANTGQFSGDFQLVSAIVRNVVPDVADPQPRLVTTGEINVSGSTFTHPIQGAFIRVEKAELVQQFGSGGLNIQNGQIDDGTGATIIRVDDGVADRNNLTNLFTVGTCYNFQGFGANFAGAGQIFLRSMDAADMEVVPCN